MIGVRSFAVVLLAVAAPLVACSSGNGASKTTFACASNSPTSSENSAESACIQSKCSSQATAALGPDWASGDVAGGSCASFIGCIAKCGCDDTACFTNCGMGASAQCQKDEEAFGACDEANCEGGTNGDDGGGSPTVTGDGGIGSEICVIENGSSCPTANLSGCCTLEGIEECDYPPITAADGMQACTGGGGTWSTHQ
jgi:hypothetical protein